MERLRKYLPRMINLAFFYWLTLYEALNQAPKESLSSCAALEQVIQDENDCCKTVTVQKAILQLLAEFNQSKLLSTYIDRVRPNEALAILKKKYLDFFKSQAYQYAITIWAEKPGVFSKLMPELQALIFSFLLPLKPAALVVTSSEKYEAFKQATSAALRAINNLIRKRAASYDPGNKPQLFIGQSVPEIKPLSFSGFQVTSPGSSEQQMSIVSKRKRERKSNKSES